MMALTLAPRDPSAFTSGWDEDRGEDGSPRAGYGEMLDALERCDLDGLSQTVAARLAGGGVNFGTSPFVVDPVPRLIPSSEWDPLADGLTQRARALNLFLRDAYGAREVVRAGILSSETIERAEGYEPDLLHRLPAEGAPAAVIGFDVVRDAAGEFLVLEDNLRTPSGYAYALAARAVLREVLPAGLPVPRPVESVTCAGLRAAVDAASPRAGADPSVVVLTDGPGNTAYYEHAAAARSLGAPLVTLGELEGARGGLRARLPGGGSRPIDVVYRRTDEDRVRDEHGRLTAEGAVLLEPWLRGSVGIVNAFGNGLGDDKLVHSHVEDFIRFYLGEEPLVRSVPTYTLAGAAERERVIGHLRDHVIKPRAGYGGQGVVICAHADEDDLERLAADLERHPERYIAQPTVALSRHPTVIGGRLEPRHIDLRPFAFMGDDVLVVPGGLTRVALDEGALVVNSSQNGGGKDTWVLDDP